MLGEDLGPQTLTEVWFAVTAVIIGAVIFAVVLGNVTILIDNISKAESTFQERLHDIARKLDRLKVPHALKRRVLEYYSYAHTHIGAHDALAMFNGEPSDILLSSSLRQEIALHAHTRTLAA